MQVLDAPDCACEKASAQGAVGHDADPQFSARGDDICLQMPSRSYARAVTTEHVNWLGWASKHS